MYAPDCGFRLDWPSLKYEAERRSVTFPNNLIYQWVCHTRYFAEETGLLHTKFCTRWNFVILASKFWNKIWLRLQEIAWFFVDTSKNFLSREGAPPPLPDPPRRHAAHATRALRALHIANVTSHTSTDRLLAVALLFWPLPHWYIYMNICNIYLYICIYIQIEVFSIKCDNDTKTSLLFAGSLVSSLE